MADAGVGTSTCGLGQDFNEELMTAMARSGQGNAYYGQTAVCSSALGTNPEGGNTLLTLIVAAHARARTRPCRASRR